MSIYGHLQLFLLFQQLSSDKWKKKMALIPSLRPRVAHLWLQSKVKEKEAGDYCSPGRPGTAAGQIGTQFGWSHGCWDGSPLSLRLTDAGADAKVAWGLQSLPQNWATHVWGDGRKTDPQNLQAPGLSARFACWPETGNHSEVPCHQWLLPQFGFQLHTAPYPCLFLKCALTS